MRGFYGFINIRVAKLIFGNRVTTRANLFKSEFSTFPLILEIGLGWSVLRKSAIWGKEAKLN